MASEMMTLDEIAELAKVTKPTLRRWLRLGLMPAGRRLGPRCVRWPRATIESWLQGGGVQQHVAGVVPFQSTWLPDEPMATAADLAEIDAAEIPG